MSDASGCAFVETKEYRRFREFCDACRRDRYIGLCYGPSGVGKTLSARRYANWDAVERHQSQGSHDVVALEDVLGSSVVLYTPPVVVTSSGRLPGDIDRLRDQLRELSWEEIRREEKDKMDVIQKELDELYEPVCWRVNSRPLPPEEIDRRHRAWREANDLMSARLRARPDPTALIVVDEADRLKMTGLEQLRDVFDRGDIGLVLIGMPGLEKRLARYAQLYSRIGFVHEFRPLTPGEVREVLRRWRPVGVRLPEDMLADDEGVAALIRVTGGNFRLLQRLLSQAGRVLEINGLGVMTREVVETAREVLVIGAT